MIVHTAIIDTGDRQVDLIVAATEADLTRALAENYAEEELSDGMTPERAVQEVSRYIDITTDTRHVVGTEE